MNELDMQNVRVNIIYDNIDYLIQATSDSDLVNKIVGKSIAKVLLSHESSFSNPDSVSAQREFGVYFSKELQDIRLRAIKTGSLDSRVVLDHFSDIKYIIDNSEPESKIGKNLSKSLAGKNNYNFLLGLLGGNIVEKIHNERRPYVKDSVSLDKKSIEKGKGGFKTIYSEMNKIYEVINKGIYWGIVWN